ncbi:MAG: plasmid mobilization relaxosome protein MobC [Oscillospiraceae bacterium]|nr:plasmid mobilization relaxosome protein MobC [Oscillospiraceae bacterium]
MSDSINKKHRRKRHIHLHFCVDEEENNLIRKRMADAGVVSLGAYLRKMSIDGYHINVDLTDVRELVSLLRRCSNNLNQIAKRTNETRSIYEADIEDLRQQYDTLWDAANGILAGLAKIK